MGQCVSLKTGTTNSSVSAEEACPCSGYHDSVLLHVLACLELAEGQNASTVENLALQQDYRK